MIYNKVYVPASNRSDLELYKRAAAWLSEDRGYSLQDCLILEESGNMHIMGDLQCNAPFQYGELKRMKDPVKVMSLTMRRKSYDSFMPKCRNYRAMVKKYYNWLVNDSYFSKWITSDVRFTYLHGIVIDVREIPRPVLGAILILHRQAWEHSSYVKTWYAGYKHGLTGDEALLFAQTFNIPSTRNAMPLSSCLYVHKPFISNLSLDFAWKFLNHKPESREDSALFSGGMNSLDGNTVYWSSKGYDKLYPACKAQLKQMKAAKTKQYEVFGLVNIVNMYTAKQLVSVFKNVIGDMK